MIPDLGPYALWVLSAYAVSLAGLALIVALSVWQARRTRARLQRMEAGRRSAPTPQPDTSAQTPTGTSAHG